MSDEMRKGYATWEAYARALEAEVARLKLDADVRAYPPDLDAMKARAEKAEADLAALRVQADRDRAIAGERLPHAPPSDYVCETCGNPPRRRTETEDGCGR